MRRSLRRHIAQSEGTTDEKRPEKNGLRSNVAAMSAPPALVALCEAFGLTPFEREVLVMCAGVELDASFGALCADAQGDPRRTFPTYSLALAALPDEHWSALSPASPLRYWRLIQVGSGDSLTLSPLRIDERVLHYLAGIQHLDERLAGLIQQAHEHVTESVVPSQSAVAERMAATWSKMSERGQLPVIQLCGEDGASMLATAASACTRLGLNLHTTTSQVVPLDPRELDAFLKLWGREAMLTTSALLLDCGEADTGDAARESAIGRLIEGATGALIVAGRERRETSRRPVITFNVGKPTPSEQRRLWHDALGKVAPRLNGQVDALVSQFSLSAGSIESVCAEVLGRAVIDAQSDSKLADNMGVMLWEGCRTQVSPRLEGLAQRIEPVARWNDLVLPEYQRHVLSEVAVHVRQRSKVYESWGFANKSSRGLGISALFSGPSGTGKTMAAEVLANELNLDLFVKTPRQPGARWG